MWVYQEHDVCKAADVHPTSPLTERVQEDAEDVAHDGLAVEVLHAGAGALDQSEHELRQSQVFVGARVVEDGQLVQLTAVLNLGRRERCSSRIRNRLGRRRSVSGSNEAYPARWRQDENNERW